MSATMRRWVPQSSIKWSVRIAAIGLVVGGAMVGIYLSAASPVARRIKLIEIVGKNTPGTVVIDDKTGVVNGEVVSGQAIATQSATKVSLQQSGSTTARLGENSLITVDNNCLQLGRGQAVLSGTPGCLGAVIVTSKDGIYTLERLGSLGEIKVLSGQVDLSIPSNRAVESISLQPNQKITVSLAGDEVGPVRLMLPTEVEAVLKGELFQAFQFPLANQTRIAGLQPLVTPSPTALPTKLLPDPPRPVAGAVKPQAMKVAPAPVHAADEESDDRAPEADNVPSSRPVYIRRLRRQRADIRGDRYAYSYRRQWHSRDPDTIANRHPAPTYDEPDARPPATPEPHTVEFPHPSADLPSTIPPIPTPLPHPIVVEPPLEPISPESDLPVAPH